MAGVTFEAGQPAAPQPMHTGSVVSGTALPPAVAERIFAIQDRAETLHAAMPASEQRLSLATERVQAVQRLERLEGHPSARGGGFNLGPDDIRVVQQRKVVEELTAAKERLEARYQRTSEVWQKAARVRKTVEDWVRERPPTAVEDAPTEPPKLLKGESLLDGIERYRRHARELVAKLRRIENAPYPREYCRQKATAQIMAMAERGRVLADGLVERDSQLHFPTMQLASQVHNVEGRGAIAFAPDVPDVLAILAAVHTDGMIAAAHKAVDEVCSGKTGALDHAERQHQAVQIENDLLALEREESALVHLALTQGMPTEHRADCNVQAILQCRLVTQPRHDA